MNLCTPLIPEETAKRLLSSEIEGQCLKMIIAISVKFKLMTSQGCKDDHKVNSEKSILYKWSWYTPRKT